MLRAGLVRTLVLCIACVGCARGVTPVAPAPSPAQGIPVPSPDRALAPALSPSPPETASATVSPTAPRSAVTRAPRPETSRSGAPAGGGRAQSPSVQNNPVALPPGAEQPSGRSCPADAPIKGSSARVYHTPASRTYETVMPVLCFSSTASAAAAGYRPAGN